MKKVILTLFAVALATFSYSKNNDQFTILNKYIIANNAGTEKAISQFIKETYEPELYTRIDLKAHIEFYTMISKDLGQLTPILYEKIKETPLKIAVYLIKEEENLFNKNIDPSEILMVEFDFNERNPKFLNRALGLGTLPCALKKESNNL